MKNLCHRCSDVVLTFLSIILCCRQAVTAKCPSQALQGTSGSLSTPNYPSNYRSFSNCSWSIKVPEGQTIQLTFLDFLLEKDFQCNADSVRVYDGKDTSATMIGSYCSGMKPFNVYSTSDRVYIRFTSDRSLNYRGFRATYKVHGQTTTQAPTMHITIPPTTTVAMVFTRRIKNVTTVVVGDEVKLHCQVIGAKNINIVWSKDKNPVALDRINQVSSADGLKSTLRIKKVVKEDAGDYVCIANDDASHVIHSSGRLVVKELPVTTPTVGEKPTTGKTTAPAVTTQHVQSTVGVKPVITHPPENMTAQYGEAVILMCEARGFPVPYISWFMDGTLVANNTKAGMSNFKFKVKEPVTKVRCEAQNLHGNDFRDAFVAIVVHSSVVAATQPGEQSVSLSLETLVIVTLCVFLAVVLLALGMIVFIHNRKHVNHLKIPLPTNLEQLAQNPIFEQSSNDYANPQLEDWELPRNNIEFMNDLVDGTFFRIFLGKLNHPTRGDEGSLVMVKALKEANPSGSLKERFDEDAFKWGTVRHLNVQSLLGICAVDRPLCLVFEYEDLTNLGNFLRDCGRNHYTIHQKSNPDDDKLELSNLDQIGIATQIAAGMEYLSARGHIHKELCVKNCVINVKSMAVKISNLGFSWLAPSTSYHMLSAPEQDQYPVRWLPPEAILQGTFGDETDMWSFGVVLWEIYSSGLKPYYGMGNEEVISIVREGDVLPCPKECPKEVYEIMRECWHMEPSRRPLFSTIHQKISTLYSGVAV